MATIIELHFYNRLTLLKEYKNLDFAIQNMRGEFNF